MHQVINNLCVGVVFQNKAMKKIRLEMSSVTM